MKSLLVEALRQKDKKQDDDGISDSGSFATSHADLVTGSEEVVTDPGDQVAETEAEGDGELELMATGALVVANDDDDVAADTEEPDFTATIAAATTQLAVGVDLADPHDSLPAMPPLARFAPAICLGLAAVSAIGWFLLQRMELRQDIFGAFVGMPDRAAAAESAARSATTPRFRYLDLDGQPLEDEVPE